MAKKQKNIILENLLSLSVAEMATKGIVFLINAYIARVFDVEGYGIIANVNAILSYALAFVQLGFNVIGMRAIARNPEDKEKYVNNIITLRLIIAVISFFILCVYTYFLDKPMILKSALLLSGIQIFSSAIYIDWFYQGIEKMKIIGVRQLLSYLITFIGVITFIKTYDDIPLYMAIFSLSLLVNNFWLNILYIKKYAKIKLSISLNFWKELLKPAIPIGLSSIAVLIFNNFNLMYLPYVCGNYENGLFNAALKLSIFFSIIAAIIQGAFIPRIARAVTVEEKKLSLEKYTKMVAICGLIVAVTVFTFPDFFINIVLGKNYLPAIPILRILLINLIIQFYNSTVFAPLQTWHKEKKIMISVFICAIINIAVSLLIVPTYMGRGAAIANICSEFFMTVSLSILMYKEIHSLRIGIFIRTLIIAVAAALLSSQLLKIVHNSLIPIIATFIIFCILLLISKTVKIQEIKDILHRT